MRKFGALWFVFFSTLSFADEPSVQAGCASGYQEYQHNDTKLQLCPTNNDGAYSVDATAVGSNYHTCWWPLTLSKVNGIYSASKEDCTLNVTFGDGSLDAQFIGKCRYSCGARASFSSGKFFENVTANTKTRPLGEANSARTQAIQLWTGHRLLTDDIAACANKVEVTLNSFGFRSITKSTYPTETYFYANFEENRIGIHCTNIAGQTFVYGSVAGVDVKTVELLRNSIFEKL